MKNKTWLIAIAFGLSVVSAACTPQQIVWFLDITEPTRHELNNEELHRLRICESTDNYRAVSPSGTYRGAYQFNQPTWDGVANRHYPWLIGSDPVDVEPWWQDAMARALWSERGAQPWPVCGKRV